MALKQISQKELKVILDQHKLWLSSNGREGRKAALNRTNLYKVNLRESDIRGVNLNGSNLRAVNLKDVNISGAYLSKADLSGANLNGANLSKANLAGANLIGANLIRTNLRESNLSGANLSQAILRQADLSKADLNATDLYRADFHEANIMQVDFSNSRLERTSFLKVNCNVLGNWIDAKYNGTIMDSYLYNKLPNELIEANKGNIFVEDFIISNDPDAIIRSIEFPPEYCEAGKGILSYFGTVLQQKYPDKKTKVKIEQDGLKVTMIVETEEGDKEEIEKFLDQYGLVVSGELRPDELFENREYVLELKQELAFAKLRLEQKQEILNYTQSNNKHLETLLSQAIQSKQGVNVNINANNNSSVSQNQTFNLSMNLSGLQGTLNELIESINEEHRSEVEELKVFLTKINSNPSKENVSSSPALSKLKRFLKDVEDKEKTAGKIVARVKDGAGIAQDLAEQYNKIAEWCGLPIVPKPFLKN